MEELLKTLIGNMQRGGGIQLAKSHKQSDAPKMDTSEIIYISSLALLKMLKHGRAGIPMEVMGLMLGEFVDEYTVNVVDVFAMPQSGTGVSVEAIDDVFQTNMLEMLKKTGRPENVVGWYHSHPGFGCWLSAVDVQTQQMFEKLNERSVAVVVDPVQSVKGKVIIDAFRSINPMLLATKEEPRLVTSSIGHLQRPTLQSIIHGLNRHYYSIPIAYKTNHLEQTMLLNMSKNTWMHSLEPEKFEYHCERNDKAMDHMGRLAKLYKKTFDDEEKLTKEQLVIKNVGKQDPKRHLGEVANKMIEDNIVQNVTSMVDTSAFQ